jgi:integrase
MRFLNPGEIARLADAIGPRYRALVLLGAYGGLRMGELAALRRGRVDLVGGTVHIATDQPPEPSSEAPERLATIGDMAAPPLCNCEYAGGRSGRIAVRL